MPCPNPKNYGGNDYVDANAQKSATAAMAAAAALVPRAAKRSCIHDAISSGLCPSDCPYPYPFNVQYSIVSVTASPQWVVNILVGWFTRIFSGHWWWMGRAHYAYRGFVGCTKQRQWYALADDAVVESDVDVA